MVVERLDDGRVQVQPQRPAHQTSNASQTGRSGNLADLYRDQRLPSCQIVAVSPCGRRWQQFAGVAPPGKDQRPSPRARGPATPLASRSESRAADATPFASRSCSLSRAVTAQKINAQADPEAPTRICFGRYRRRVRSPRPGRRRRCERNKRCSFLVSRTSSVSTRVR